MGREISTPCWLSSINYLSILPVVYILRNISIRFLERDYPAHYAKHLMDCEIREKTRYEEYSQNNMRSYRKVLDIVLPGYICRTYRPDDGKQSKTSYRVYCKCSIYSRTSHNVLSGLLNFWENVDRYDFCQNITESLLQLCWSRIKQLQIVLSSVQSLSRMTPAFSGKSY